MTRRKTSVPDVSENGQRSEDFPYGANAPATEGQTEEAGADTSPAESPPRLQAEPQSSPAALDPFDPATYRKQPSLLVAAGVEKRITELSVRRPDKSWWVRVHPNPEYTLSTFVMTRRRAGSCRRVFLTKGATERK